MLVVDDDATLAFGDASDAVVTLDFAGDFALVAAGFSKSAAVKCGFVAGAPFTIAWLDPVKLLPVVLPVEVLLLGRKASACDPPTEDAPLAPNTTPLPNAAPLAIIARDSPPELE